MRFGYDIRSEVLCFQVENSFTLQYRESFVYTVYFYISINALVFDPVTKISILNSERACTINCPKKICTRCIRFFLCDAGWRIQTNTVLLTLFSPKNFAVFESQYLLQFFHKSKIVGVPMFNALVNCLV